MKVVLLSYHYFESKLRAGFHHLAEAYWDMGWEVVFATAPLSPLSRLVRDERLRYPVLAEANRPKQVRDRLTSYVLYSRVHPANLRVAPLNRLAGRRLVDAYRRSSLGALEHELATADLIIFESTPAIALVPVVRRLASRARLVYRVSDDLEALHVNPAVLDAELEALPLFDEVSSPSRHLVQKLGAVREVHHQQHAVNKRLLDAKNASPYLGGVNAVWVGKILLDPAFLDAASTRLPDWTFHVISPAAPSNSRPNIVWHGELGYESTIPFVQHADVGLATFGDHTGHVPRYLADSSGKFVQYAYCGLPTVAPAALRSERPHVFYYEFGDADSIEAALRAALAAGRRPELADEIPSWEELATSLAGKAGLC